MTAAFRHPVPWPALAAFVVAAALAPPLVGDAITFSGTGIALEGCRVEGFHGGEVIYIDSSGRRQRRPIADVAAIAFDDLSELDAAEARLGERDVDGGIERLAAALARTDDPIRETWIRRRLAIIHDARGEFTFAVAHAAGVFVADPDPFWRELRPLSAPDAPDYIAAREALDQLRRADRGVREPTLAAIVDELIVAVTPLYETAARVYRGPEIEPESTISGYQRAQLMAPPAEPAREEPAPSVVGDPALPKPSRPAPGGGDAPAAIERRLAGGDFAGALAACERVAARIDRRDRGELLNQHGRALAGTGRPRKAAVMFMRGAILHPDSKWAAASLVATAAIYRDEFGDARTARRLLVRAIDRAERAGDDVILEQARRMRGTLERSVPEG